jgi:hypothetical protein
MFFFNSFPFPLITTTRQLLQWASNIFSHWLAIVNEQQIIDFTLHQTEILNILQLGREITNICNDNISKDNQTVFQEKLMLWVALTHSNLPKIYFIKRLKTAQNEKMNEIIDFLYQVNLLILLTYESISRLKNSQEIIQSLSHVMPSFLLVNEQIKMLTYLAKMPSPDPIASKDTTVKSSMTYLSQLTLFSSSASLIIQNTYDLLIPIVVLNEILLIKQMTLNVPSKNEHPSTQDKYLLLYTLITKIASQKNTDFHGLNWLTLIYFSLKIDNHKHDNAHFLIVEQLVQQTSTEPLLQSGNKLLILADRLLNEPPLIVRKKKPAYFPFSFNTLREFSIQYMSTVNDFCAHYKDNNGLTEFDISLSPQGMFLITELFAMPIERIITIEKITHFFDEFEKSIKPSKDKNITHLSPAESLEPSLLLLTECLNNVINALTLLFKKLPISSNHYTEALNITLLELNTFHTLLQEKYRQAVCLQTNFLTFKQNAIDTSNRATQELLSQEEAFKLIKVTQLPQGLKNAITAIKIHFTPNKTSHIETFLKPSEAKEMTPLQIISDHIQQNAIDNAIKYCQQFLQKNPTVSLLRAHVLYRLICIYTSKKLANVSILKGNFLSEAKQLHMTLNLSSEKEELKSLCYFIDDRFSLVEDNPKTITHSQKNEATLTSSNLTQPSHSFLLFAKNQTLHPLDKIVMAFFSKQVSAEELLKTLEVILKTAHYPFTTCDALVKRLVTLTDNRIQKNIDVDIRIFLAILLFPLIQTAVLGQPTVLSIEKILLNANETLNISASYLRQIIGMYAIQFGILQPYYFNDETTIYQSVELTQHYVIALMKCQYGFNDNIKRANSPIYYLHDYFSRYLFYKHYEQSNRERNATHASMLFAMTNPINIMSTISDIGFFPNEAIILHLLTCFKKLDNSTTAIDEWKTFLISTETLTKALDDWFSHSTQVTDIAIPNHT